MKDKKALDEPFTFVSPSIIRGSILHPGCLILIDRNQRDILRGIREERENRALGFMRLCPIYAHQG